jgi:hypothetical protein
MNRHDYYFGQHVTDAELDEGFDFAEVADRAMMADEGTFGVCKGFGVAEHSPAPNMTVDVAGPGAAYDQLGQRISFPSLQNCDVSVDHNGAGTAVVNPGNEKIVSVFIKFKRVLSDPRIDDHPATVYFLSSESWEFYVTQGAEGAHPAAPPALEADAVLLADVHLIFGQASVLNADIMCTSAIADHSLRTQWTFPLALTGRYVQKEVKAQAGDAFDGIMGYLSSHFSGTDFEHATADMTAPEDAGHAHYNLIAGTLASQIAALLDDVNDAYPWAGGTIDGDLLPHADGGVDALGDGTHHWNIFFQDAYGEGTGSLTTGSVVPVEDNAFGDPGTLYKNNVPVAWGHITGSALADPHFNVLSVGHPAVGHYTVTLDHAAGTKIVPVATPCGTGQRVYVNVTITSTSVFEIYLRNDAGAATDCDCTFHVMGI